jgi:hypothetical protein
MYCGLAQRPLKACLPRREVGLPDDERHGPQVVRAAESSDAHGTPGALSLVRETATGSSSEVRDTFDIPHPALQLKAGCPYRKSLRHRRTLFVERR